MRYFHSSIVPLLYFWSSASKWPPSILMQSSALGRTSLTALLTSSSSREATKSLTTSLSSSRVLGLTLRTSTFPSRSESVVRGGASSGLRVGQGIAVLPETMRLSNFCYRFLCCELGLRRHLKWHLNITNGKICLVPDLYKPPVIRISSYYAFINNYRGCLASGLNGTHCIM